MGQLLCFLRELSVETLRFFQVFLRCGIWVLTLYSVCEGLVVNFKRVDSRMLSLGCASYSRIEIPPSVSVGCWDCAQSLIKASLQLPDTAYLQHVSSGPHFRMGHHHKPGYTHLTHPITISLATRLLLMDSSVLAWALIELHTAWTSDDCIACILQTLCLVRRFYLGQLPQTMTSAYAAHQHHDALLGFLSYNTTGTCPLTPSLDFS